jgi:beta-galactosidase
MTSSTAATEPRFAFGVDYYPEQWPETRWAVDADMMRQAGFNVVRLAEFAWSRLEPREGEFNFAWLDRAIEVLCAREMEVVLGSPTAAPPAWVMRKQPDAYRVLDDGRRVTFGHRRHYCPNHPGFREQTRAIVTAMADHYRGNPAVIGWQIDNEFGDPCYCPNCARAFGRWLRRRYGSLEELNRRWGTVFWSQEYDDWDSISLPTRNARAPNPGLHLDYFRFASDSYVEYQNVHIEILRRAQPDWFITHNLMGSKYEQIDYFDLAAPLDFVSWDNYPRLAWNMVPDVDVAAVALAHDTTRGLKRRNFWVMEAQSGASGWENVSVAPRPGEIHLWAWQAIAHGADGIVFFRWRTARFGAEQYWHGVLDHHGEPGWRYAEVQHMGEELARVGRAIVGTVPRAQVALVLSYDSRFAFQAQGNNPGFSYPTHLASLYAAFFRCNIAVDMVSPDVDLSGYRVVVAPALHVISPEIADRLHRFVESGGVLLCTARSGVKGMDNEVTELRLPGLLRELFGLSVEEYDSPAIGVTIPLRSVEPSNTLGEAVAEGWCDMLAFATATPLLQYTEDYYAGRCAAAENRLGKGRAVYVGTFGNAALHDWLARYLLDAASIAPDIQPEGIELRWRYGRDDAALLFVLNHAEVARSVSLPGTFTDLLDGSVLRGSAELPGRGVRVLATGAAAPD